MDKKNKLSILVGKNICELRKELQISQKDLAIKLDVSQDAIMKIEKGIIAPKMSRLEEIANVLECTVIRLFKDEQKLEATDCLQYFSEAINSLNSEERKYLVEIMESTIKFMQNRLK